MDFLEMLAIQQITADRADPWVFFDSIVGLMKNGIR
jgi:hypothetical protein